MIAQPAATPPVAATALAAQVFAPRDLRLVATDLGPLAPGRVRIGFRAGGICGSDIHYFSHARNGDFAVTSPLTLGHELAGEVLALGEGVSRLAVGDRVAVNPSRWCGTCARCREGRVNLCESVFFMGSASRVPHMQGGFATAFDVHPGQCHPIPASVPFEAAALAEPLAVCLHAVSRAGDVSGAAVVVMGAGPIGLLTAMVARHRGAARVMMTDIRPAALAFAASLGFDVGSPANLPAAELDVAFEAAGAAEALANAVTAVRRGGRIVQIGNIAEKAIPVPVNLLVSKEIDLLGSFRFGDEFALAVELIETGAIAVADIITARLPFEAAPDAFVLATDRGTANAKIVLVGAAA